MSDTLWGVLIGGALTFAATVGAEYLRGSRAARAEREAREDRRRAERDAFQRQTLLALQVALADLAAVTSRIGLADDERHAATGQWSLDTPDPELREANRRANMEVSRLASLVLDADCRAAAGTATRTAVEAKMATGDGRALALVQHGLAASHAAERCGELARALF